MPSKEMAALQSIQRGSVLLLLYTDVEPKDLFSHHDGFNNWKGAEERMRQHKDSEGHRDCIILFHLRSTESAHVDHDLEKQCQKQKKYWVEVVRRVVAVVTFLAERGLPFRGDDELIGIRRNGNFLGVIELIAEFDPFLAKHVEEFGNKGRGNPSYLSSTIYEEVIQIMAKKVKEHIVAEVAASKYYSVSVDSTPDLTYVDQLTTIIWYVLDGKPVERFLTFHQMTSHKAEAIATPLLEYLERETINFQDCRGQSYDNASNMSGKYSGMQARLKEVNPLALYIPCAGHSLNLVGTAAASCCVEVISLFGFIRRSIRSSQRPRIDGRS